MGRARPSPPAGTRGHHPSNPPARPRPDRAISPIDSRHARRGLISIARAALYALLLWAPLALGAYRGWLLAIVELLTLGGLACWVVGMAMERRLEWRRTALDLPLALLIALVLTQLALGNRPLAAWALGPAAADPALPVEFPARLFTLGTVSPAQTLRSFLLFLTYAGVYVLVVNVVRSRDQLDRLVRMLLLVGGVLAFLGLLDYLGREAWLIRWRDHPLGGRLAGTFVNPDHFAAWLAMLVCLGIGHLQARSRSGGEADSVRPLVTSPEGRERLARRYLPFVGVGVMALALLFTLSRGGALGLVVALAAMLALEGALGRTRWSLVMVGAVLAVMVGYGAWIGLDPFLQRLRQGPYVSRLIQSLTSLEMLKPFPLLGVGLGAYRDIYFRYQPAALGPGKVYFPFAHNDLLQLAVETGLLGLASSLFATWRIGRDLVGAHLLGRAPCPVGGGEEGGAQRRDRMSVGIAVGALGGVLALLVHSGLDFGARIPANGVLAAACLGIATVALHTRFGGHGERLLTGVRTFSLGRGRLASAITSASALALSLAIVPLIVRPALVDAKLEALEAKPASARVAEALGIDPHDFRALGLRGQLRLAAARKLWDSGETPDGRVLRSWEERRREALGLLSGGAQDLRATLALTPSDPLVHETLAWVYGTMAAIESESPAQHFALALTSLHRAIALQPENPFLYRSLAALALSQREPPLPIALDAGRQAIRRDPDLLENLVDRFLAAGLSESQWVALVPGSALDRLDLGALLEAGGLSREAEYAYRRAAELAGPAEEPLVRFMVARLLIGLQAYQPALRELDEAIKQDGENPELHLTRATALAGRGDPTALAAYRRAILSADARAQTPAADPFPFQISTPRVRGLVARALGPGDPFRPVRYHRALARYLTDRKLWDQALGEWDAVVARAPQDAGAHFARGVVLDALGARDRALDAYRKAASLDEHSVSFRVRLAQRLWETEQFYQAMNEWRAVLVEQPGNVEARLALAGAHLSIGERMEAFREYQRVLQIAPGNPEAQRGLARLRGAPLGLN